MGNKLIIGLIILVWIIGIGVVIIVKGQKNLEEPVKIAVIPTPTSMPTIIPTQSLGVKEEKVEELKIEDLKIGTGTEAVDGKVVSVNYKGTLVNGTQFDSSYDRGTPFSFTLGAGEVIQGWDLGVKGMKVGGKRKLTIPADLGYGAKGVGTIPPNATLIFEVELLKVE